MDRLRIRLTLLGLAATLNVVTASAAPLDDRPTIAIVEFDTTPAGTVLPPPQLGVTLADLMLDKLVASERFRVLDGRWLQSTSTQGRAGDFAALRAHAEAAGVDYLVLGSVTRFSTENRRRGVGGAALFKPLLGGYRRQKTELALAITLRIVDVRSGEVRTSVSAQGTSGRKNLALGGLGLKAGVAGALVNAASTFRDSLLDEAMQRVVATAATGLVNAAPRLAREIPDRVLSRQKPLHLRPNRRFDWHTRIEIPPARLQGALTGVPGALACTRSGVQIFDDGISDT